ncbi:MAG TPA: CDP-glucose 4,6-dehydratase [Niabella sp.]|uniref:CDP-glucose 4,6-dehydratase n=1 Tax=Agriterribacter sp. TaxID=2821509 RepID=UPI002C4D70C5|nr:CDP-glucose 4,6-dehydratase [Agriterribacter sp.]HRO85727.1 CDP-glucose 4,6-dehydratase [Niabella sp.]HRP54955.1 CDP-glucose 4,6-dehydratase [Agriterribacter sp.]
MVSKASLTDFYKHKKIFVTGHTGFKGTWLLLLLHELGAKVKGYALAPEFEYSLFNITEAKNLSESIIADIKDKERLQAEIEAYQPDYIFHLAAQSLVRRSYKIPAETFEVNVTGTANLLECISLLRKKCTTVVITTDKVYENKEQHILYKEEDILGGYDPYSASKACTELVVSSFRKSFFNVGKFNEHQKSLASARAGNVIGGGDWSTDRIIPDIIRSLQSRQNIIVRNPTSVRPWQHVLEPLTGYLLLGGLVNEDAGKYSTAFNFGPLPGDHLTVKALVEKAIDKWGSGSWTDASGSYQPHEASLLQLDITKAQTELGWRPKLDAASSIDWTINWYKQPDSKKKDCTLRQINTYLAL